MAEEPSVKETGAGVIPGLPTSTIDERSFESSRGWDTTDLTSIDFTFHFSPSIPQPWTRRDETSNHQLIVAVSCEAVSTGNISSFQASIPPSRLMTFLIPARSAMLAAMTDRPPVLHW